MLPLQNGVPLSARQTCLSRIISGKYIHSFMLSNCNYHMSIFPLPFLFLAQQYYPEEEDDYDSVDLLSLFIAMTLLDDDEDDDEDDDIGIPFYLSEEYGL